MSLPGLQLNALPIEEKALIVHELSPSTEWRFEVAFGDTVDVKLISGTAELFGTELALHQTYTFNGCKSAIYTWHGCRLEVTGKCQSDYIAEETPMSSYANAHFALENLRLAAAESNTVGPRVLVVGPENAGKTTMAKILASYAARTGYQPVVVNTDPKEGLLSIPGTLSTLVLDSVVDVEEGWGSSPTNGPSQIPVKLPLVYYYGLADPEAKADLYKSITTRLALSVMNRMEDDNEVKPAGCIIDTSGAISQGKEGYGIIAHLVAEFAVDVLIILGSERLYSDLSRRFSNINNGASGSISVVKLDKSGGCIDRDAEYLHRFRQAQIREYFFGDAKNGLSPYAQQIDFSEAIIYKLAQASTLLDSFLPGGEAEDVGEQPLFDRVQPSSLMQSCILAIIQAEPNDTQENIRDASVIGFVYVAEVDEKRKKIRLLAPLGGRLPRKAMVWGAWPESAGELVG